MGKIVSIHAPYAGSDKKPVRMRYKWYEFQSTPPMQGATTDLWPNILLTIQFQSTPPMQGATENVVVFATIKKFQSTPPMQGATETTGNTCTLSPEFQSTPPMQGATELRA